MMVCSQKSACKNRQAHTSLSRGFSLVEMLVVLSAASLVIVGTSGMVEQITTIQSATNERNMLIRDARFAMQRMVMAVSNSDRLLLPLADRDSTAWREDVRRQTIPPSPPEPGSTFASAVLAVTADQSLDLDGNGVPDIDNDQDGRINEDWPGDISNDGATGLIGIDDNGNGQVDEGFDSRDDDEYLGFADEDALNYLDDDGDNSIDEDPPADMNGDGEPGVAGVDDDGDGFFDEGLSADDDEDGQADEDWLDTTAFYLQGDTLVERVPVPWDTNSDTQVNGQDFIELPIANNVTEFRVVRRPLSSAGMQLVGIRLELTGDSGEPFSILTRVRVGGAL